MKRTSPNPGQIFLVVALSLCLYLFYGILRPFLFSLILAMTIVCLFQRHFIWLDERLAGRKNLSSGIMCISVTGLILVPLFLVFMSIVEELGLAYNSFLVNQTKMQQLLERPLIEFLNPLFNQLPPFLRVDEGSLSSLMAVRVEAIVSFLVTQSSSLLGEVGRIVINFLVMMFSMFFLFRDGRSLLYRMRELIPLERRYQDVLIGNLQSIVQATFVGIFATGLCQGFLAALIFWGLGIDNPVFWGGLVVVASTIPIAGTGLVWMPVAVYLVLSGSLAQGIILAVLGALIISLIDNIIRPVIIQGRSDGIHILLLFFALAGGLLFFGPAGLVLGPLVTALLMGLLEIYGLEFRQLDSE